MSPLLEVEQINLKEQELLVKLHLQMIYLPILRSERNVKEEKIAQQKQS